MKPSPKAVGNRRWLLVSTDYFTTWVEVEPLANIRDVDAKRFVWKKIVTRFAKWATILRAFNIKYMPRTSIRGQVLADFVAEFVEPSFEENGKRPIMDGKSVRMISLQDPLPWKVYVDGATN